MFGTSTTQRSNLRDQKPARCRRSQDRIFRIARVALVISVGVLSITPAFANENTYAGGASSVQDAWSKHNSQTTQTWRMRQSLPTTCYAPVQIDVAETGNDSIQETSNEAEGLLQDVVSNDYVSPMQASVNYESIQTRQAQPKSIGPMRMPMPQF